MYRKGFMIKRFTGLLLLFLLLVSPAAARTKVVHLQIIETSDVHGCYFPYNFATKSVSKGGLALVSSYVNEQRKIYGKNLLLFDNGDILQGQPSSYYYNYIDTTSVHLASAILNYMKYDAGNMGNHDVETGNDVFNRWIRECHFPILGANIIKVSDNSTFLPPYAVFNREGVKVVVMGEITPGIPVWLAPNLWRGLRFLDIETVARKWMKVIQAKEKPDIVIGLFHSGTHTYMLSDKYKEDVSTVVAQNVPGFDMILAGHDHELSNKKVCNVKGDSVLVIDPGNNAKFVSSVDVTVTLKQGKVVDKKVVGSLKELASYQADPQFMSLFNSQFETLKEYVSRKIGVFTEDISLSAAYFGPSSFIDFIHEFQLKSTGAQISFVAPLSFNASIKKGDVTVGDMFNLYRYENGLYTMRLTGREIKNYLEKSYEDWTNRMTSPDDHLLLLKESKDGKAPRFVNSSFNFDSASGIIYTVDVTKPTGEKITIISMADGTPFDMDKEFKCALNSYRGNGGGELLTKGAGISQEDLPNRVLTTSQYDIRYYMIDYIQKLGTVSPHPLNQWKFIPEAWTVPAAARDSLLLFGNSRR